MTLRGVIALIRVHFSRSAMQPPWFAIRRQQQQQGGQLFDELRLMPVGSSDTEGQWNTPSISDDMALTAHFSPVRGVGAGVHTPQGLGTLAPSIQARLKSSLSALRGSATSLKWTLCHTLASCQVRSRLQQVMPLPKSNSWGSSSHVIPVRTTKTMTLRASSLLRRGRSPMGEGVTPSNNRSIRFYSAELISKFWLCVTHRQTHLTNLPTTCFVSRFQAINTI